MIDQVQSARSTFQMLPEHIAIIFVLFHPKLSVKWQINRFVEAGYRIVVVINQADPPILNAVLEMVPQLQVIPNDCNLGLATALNQGLAVAFEIQNVRYVTLFDQDSAASVELPLKLAEQFQALKRYRLACIGPKLIDEKQQRAQYGKHNRQADVLKFKTIPTSGTLISKAAYVALGPMMDSLFIDGIDHEWCCRAYSQGWQVAVSPSLVMNHNMGDVGLNLLGEYKPLHRSPIRHYYIIRNAVYLLQLSYIPTKWRLIEFFKTLRRIATYMIISTDRAKTFHYIARAVCDGFRGHLGRLVH